MRIVHAALCFFCVLGLSACGQSANIDDLKSTTGMSKDQLVSKFGEPQSKSLESTSDHPGGFWTYKASSGANCRLRFDLPPRVLGADC